MSELAYVGMCGSLRKASRNMGLLRKAAELMPQGCRLEIAEIGGLPFYNQDIPKPENVKRLAEQVERADGLIFACPEYNHSLAPALKNALDWLSREPGMRPINGKPAAIMGAGGGMGSSRAQNHLRQVCSSLNVLAINKPEFYSNAFSASFNKDGDVADPELEKRISELLEALKVWTLKVGRG